jgi:hypothetical protein
VKRTTAAVVAGLVALARPAAAQVGYDPAQSPYRDVGFRQGVTPFAGWFSAALDPAGVGPKSAPMVGLRYDLLLAGPAQFMVRAATVPGKRDVIDPRQPAGRRLIGEKPSNLLLADVGIVVNLTGQRSWHSLVPLVQFGAGVASDLTPAADIGNYKFGGTSGTTFALTVGGGVRYIPGGRLQRWEVRGDATDYLYAIKYPGSYFGTITAPQSGVLPFRSAASRWRHNAGITLGLSYRFLR